MRGKSMLVGFIGLVVVLCPIWVMGAEPVKVTTTIEAVARKKKAPSQPQPQPAPGAPKGGKFEQTRAAGAPRA